MTTPSKKLDVLGLLDIADLLQVSDETPKKWRRRDQLPEPDAAVSRGAFPLWNRMTILKWASETNRLPNQRAKADGQDAPAPAG